MVQADIVDILQQSSVVAAGYYVTDMVNESGYRWLASGSVVVACVLHSSLDAAEHEPHEPSEDWLRWELVAKPVRNFCVLVALKLRERPAVWSCVSLPTPVQEPELPLELPAEVLPKLAFEVGPHKRVVEYNYFACCLVCFRQMGRLTKSFNYSYLRRQECRPLKKVFQQH
eukprot:646396-Amphidinium_carterae.2